MERRQQQQIASVAQLTMLRPMGPSLDLNPPRIVSDLLKEITRARRVGKPVSILFIRLSVSGDGAAARNNLRKAQMRLLPRLSEALRHTDKVGQFHQNAVIAVLPGATADGAQIAVDRLKLTQGTRPMRGTEITLRVGIAEAMPEDDTVDDLIERAKPRA